MRKTLLVFALSTSIVAAGTAQAAGAAGNGAVSFPIEHFIWEKAAILSESQRG